MNYLEVYMLSRDDVLAVASAFPYTWKVIRKEAIRVAVRRQFILAAKLMAAQQGRPWAGSSHSSTFDRLLEQATAVPISELRLQNALTSSRMGGSSGGGVRGCAAAESSVPPAHERGDLPAGQPAAPRRQVSMSIPPAAGKAASQTTVKAPVATRPDDVALESVSALDASAELSDGPMRRSSADDEEGQLAGLPGVPSQVQVPSSPRGPGVLRAAGLTARCSASASGLGAGIGPSTVIGTDAPAPMLSSIAQSLPLPPKTTGSHMPDRWTGSCMARSSSYGNLVVRGELDQVTNMLRTAQKSAATSPGSRSFVKRTSHGGGQTYNVAAASAGKGAGGAQVADELNRLGQALRMELQQVIESKQEELASTVDGMREQMDSLQRGVDTILRHIAAAGSDYGSPTELSFTSAARKVPSPTSE